ncbi:glycoside hydrolase [Desertihabitans brevis]|uniref:beta-N-acetylhexosaminidase n=1 Tax=Desertihabitans brevis TaxID=2268447 RepID=A0A367YQ30_9ACTN|nr:family 20 glycosylhydrolase [Desertihabitans brevis]RCK67928.1 glycoside hydrolase [Desertihabitans brevis]
MTTPLDQLFPRSRQARVLAGDGPGPDPRLETRTDPALPAEGFRLTTGDGRVLLEHADARGLRYAGQALAQLRRSRDLATTALVVEDAPDIAVRGVMLDISRDRVPTRRTLLRLLDVLELARVNTLELYTEHTFAHPGHEVVWQDASPLTAADIAWLDDECAARLIELVPNQNTLGHMERWLEHPAYASRAECVDGFEIHGEHRGPSTVAPTAENADFINDVLAGALPHFRSRRVNIGADEPWELGQGVSAEEVARRGSGPVYFDYVRRVVEHWTTRGYTVEFWADVFGEHPELMGTTPAGAVPVVWQYDGPQLTREVVAAASPALRAQWEEVGLDVDALTDGFRARAAVLSRAGEPFWVAPGTSTWQSFVGRLDNAVDNLVDAAEVAVESGAGGYLTTVWGDHGHFDPPSVTFGPLLLGGALSWGLEANRDLDLAAVLDQHLLLDPTGTTGRVLVAVGRAATALGAPVLNTSQLFTVLLRAGALVEGTWPSADGVEAADRLLADALEELDGADPACADGDVVLAELRQAIRFARFGAEVLRLGPDGLAELPAPRAAVLLRRLEDLLAEHRRTWLLRSRPGGLDDSCARLDRLRRLLTVRAAA